MKKLLFLLSIFALGSTGNLFAQNPNCFIQISPMNSTICPGDSVHITAIANLLGAGQVYNFNTSTLPSGWSTTGGTVFTAPCGPNPTNTPYYWASTAAAGTYPGITTANFDVACGGVIIFDMVYAIQGQTSPCEGPDQYNEGVSLQYSLNGGATWIDIIYYAPNGTTLPSNPGVTTPGASGATPFTTWSTFTVPIPPGAMTTNTTFRWTTQTTSGTCCDNWGLDNIVINATGAPCGSTTVVNWSTGLNNSTDFYIEPTTDTTFFAIVYDTNGVQQCVSDTVSISLFNGNFTNSLPNAATVYCPSASTTATVTNIVGASLPVSYSWSSGSTTATGTLTGAGVTPDAIMFYVDITDNCGFVKTDSILLNVNQTLAFNPFTVNPQINCNPNGWATANVIGNQGTIQYAWTNAAGNPAGQAATVSLATSGWYYVTATDNVCSISDSVFIPQNLVPFTYTLADTVTTICPNGNVPTPILSLTNVYQPTFSWTGQNGITVTPNNLSYGNLHGNGIAPDIIHYYVTITSCGTSVTDSVVMIVSNVNNLNFNVQDSLFIYCPGDSALATVTNITGAQTPPAPTYSWSNGDASNSSFLNSTGLDQESIPYTVTVTDACGYTKTKTVILEVNKKLKIDNLSSVATSTCGSDGSVFAQVSGITGTPHPHWEDQTNHLNPGTGDSVLSTSWNNLGAGYYYFTVTDGVCWAKDSIEVEMLDAPVASFTANETDGCAGMAITFTNTSQNTSNFVWDFDNGNTANENTVTNHVEQYNSNATVVLIAYNTAKPNCRDTATMDIEIVVCGCTDPNALNYDPAAVVSLGNCEFPYPIVQDPNVFSPDGDGINDLFFFETKYTTEFKLVITNRWGNVVYDKTLDLTAPVGPQGWDGKTPNGAEAGDGTYFYSYTAKGITNDIQEGKGFVQLVRNK